MHRLRRRCERRLAGIRIPEPFDLDAFCAEVAARNGRRLQLAPVPGLSGMAPCGLWISVAAADYIFYDPNTSPLHAQHIVLHEIGHILGGHSGGNDANTIDSVTLSRLMPDLDPKTIGRVLGRVSYTTAQEREAEMLASLIRARAARGPSGLAGTGPRGDTLGRLAEALRFTRGSR